MERLCGKLYAENEFQKKTIERFKEAAEEDQHKVTWSPMSGKAVYDVDAAKMGEDGEAHRLTKPVALRSAYGRVLGRWEGRPKLFPKAQEMDLQEMGATIPLPGGSQVGPPDDGRG